MKRNLLSFLIGGILGTAFGIAVGFFAFPFVFPPPPAAEVLTETEQKSKVLATGTFVHANPSDTLHYGKGSVEVREGSVFLKDDFEVGPGPKYHVYLVPKAPVRAEADVTGEMFVDLGQLRAFKGSQRYALPAGLDIKAFGSVVIWCEHFSVLISPADLKHAGA